MIVGYLSEMYGKMSIPKTIGALRTIRSYAEIESANPWLQDIKRILGWTMDD